MKGWGSRHLALFTPRDTVRTCGRQAVLAGRQPQRNASAHAPARGPTTRCRRCPLLLRLHNSAVRLRLVCWRRPRLKDRVNMKDEVRCNFPCVLPLRNLKGARRDVMTWTVRGGGLQAWTRRCTSATQNRYRDELRRGWWDAMTWTVRAGGLQAGMRSWTSAEQRRLTMMNLVNHRQMHSYIVTH